MAQPKRRNSKGQYIKNYVSVTIEENLKAIAKETEIRVRPLIRDKLEETYRRKIYESYTPVSPYGQDLKEYNKTHSRKKTLHYHHTGLLASSVKALIDGNTIYIDIDKKVYDNGKTTIDVHEFLRNGTTSNPKKDTYDYKDSNGNTLYAAYYPTPKHNFEEETKKEMDNYIEELITNINSESWRRANGLERYIDKVARRDNANK